MTAPNTLMTSSHINQLIDYRNQLSLLTADFYIMANQARSLKAPHVEAKCYDIAHLVTMARNKADDVILIASAERPAPAGPPQPVKGTAT